MEHYAKILDSFIDSIAIVNKKGEIVFTNEAWKKFSRENSGDISKTGVGVDYLELCNKVTGEELENARDAAYGIKKVIHRKITHFELEYPCHSIDEQRWFIMRVTPHATDPELTIISHINITDRKNIEGKVESQIQKMKLVNERLNTALLRIVHDIQSPVTSIEGLVGLTKMNDENHPVSPYFELIENSIANLKEYIQKTLEMSAIGVVVETINFNHLISDFFDSIKYMSIIKNIDIQINIQQTVDFYSDKTELMTIISNIVNNCLKYYDIDKEKKYINIMLEVNEFEACIVINDNGIGMDKKTISRIFDLNFQGNKKVRSGSGIGLHLVQKSIQTIGGGIKVNSTLGVGTQFNIIIPSMRKFEHKKMVSE